MPKSLRRFWIQLTADRKRFTVLCTVVCVGLLFWARLIVVSNLPRTAVAHEAPMVAEGRGDKGERGSRGSDKAQAATAKSSTGATARINRVPVPIELARSLTHDPFVISPRYFPKPAHSAPPTKEAGKSDAKPVEEADQIEARMFARLQESVDRLKLEAALGGSLAVIGGKSYQLGELVSGAANEAVQFRLTEIRQRSVILECEGHQFELTMTSPGG